MVLVSSFLQDMEMPDASCRVEEEAPFAGIASAKRDEGIRSACSIFLSASTMCLEMRGGFQRFDQHEIRIRREPLASRNASASSLQVCSRARECSGRGRWCEDLTTTYRWMAMTVFCLLQVFVTPATHRQS